MPNKVGRISRDFRRGPSLHQTTGAAGVFDNQSHYIKPTPKVTAIPPLTKRKRDPKIRVIINYNTYGLYSTQYTTQSSFKANKKKEGHYWNRIEKFL